MKKIIKLNESQIRQIILESVRKVVKESVGLEKSFPEGGKIVYHSKKSMASTGGRLKYIKDNGSDELVFAWSDDRGLVVKNDEKTLRMLRSGMPKSPSASLVSLQNGKVVDIIDRDGYAVFSQKPITKMY